MRIRLLALNFDKNMPFARFQARVVSSISMYSEENATFEVFESMQELFGALQDALENDELIITAVDTKHYNKLKSALMQALETEVQYNPTILNMLESDEEMDDKTRKEFSSFPEPATVFLSKDGLYSGFGIENGEQYLMLVPIDNERINLILRNGVVPFLSKNIEAVEGEEFLSENKFYDNEKVAIAVRRLIDSQSVVAVNGTQNAEVLKSCGDNVEDFDSVFVFTPHVEDKGEVNATEYAAQLAKVSLDLSAANIGASISDIYNAGNAKFICIAVANDESAIVRKLYMAEDETEEAFVESAAIELIELIGEKASGVRSVGIEISDGPELIPEEEKKPTNKKSMIILAAVLGAIVLLCAVLGIVYKVQGENGALANALNSIFGNETTTTTTTTTTTETTTEPVEDTQATAMKLSDFMMADLIALEKKKNEPESSTTETTTGSVEEPSSEPQVVEDPGAPAVMKINGFEIEAKEALARLVMTEMGEGYNVEAIKAQAVVIYTYLKYRDTNFEIDGVLISETYNDEVKSAVDAVFGQYLSVKDEVALTPYFAVAAGKTANSADIFSKEYDYLKPVAVNGNPDAKAETYKIERKFSLGEMKGLLLQYNSKLVLDEDPALWLRVVAHDAAVSSSIGYVTKVSVGGTEISGLEFRNSVLGSSVLASHCFTVFYNETDSTFTVTSYGNGIGVGMSQTGANHLASTGMKYEKILSTYYKGTTLTKEKNV